MTRNNYILHNLHFIFLKEDTTQKSSIWDPSCSVYKVYDENNKYLSTLCIDPYLRTRKINHTWSYSGRDSSEIAGFKPIAYLMMNAPNLGDSSYLTFGQVQTLFTEVI